MITLALQRMFEYESRYINDNSVFSANIHSFGFNKKNCSDTTIVCMKNRDCYNSCQPTNDLEYIYKCNRGVCTTVRKNSFNRSQLFGPVEPKIDDSSTLESESSYMPSDEKKKICDVNHGLFYILYGSTQFSTTMWHCVSMYKDLWSNANTIIPGVCNGGSLHTNIFDHAPLLQDCKCADGFKLYGSGITYSAEEIEKPKCIKSSYAHLYSGYYREI